jgi:anti-sigma-K factor RskA/putative zinc finger protein
MTPHEWFVEHRLDYASRTLDPGDAKTFEAHLGGCEECQAEVARIEGDLKWLPMGLPPVSPRPGFRRRAIENVLQGRSARRPRWQLPAALAASALLVASGWFLGQSRAGELQRELEGQQAVVAALQDTLSIMRKAGRVLQANVDVGDTRGGLLIFADEATHRWNVVVHGLPPAPEGYRYQFWFICEDGMVRGTEVAVDQARPTMFTTGMPQPQSCPAVKGAALTEEPVADGQGPPRGRSLAHLML